MDMKKIIIGVSCFMLLFISLSVAQSKTALISENSQNERECELREKKQLLTKNKSVIAIRAQYIHLH
jgi:hypothetical protein